MAAISIIVPCHNVAAYLPKCLDSLINQTFRDIDIVTINNASTDDSLVILKKYAARDSRIKVLDTEIAGLAHARNIGLDNSDSEYVMFCDSDDWYSLEMCEIMYEAVTKSGADVACCHAFLEDDEGLSPEEKRVRHDNEYYCQKMTGKHKLNSKLILKTNVMVWNKIWRRDLLKKHGLRFPEIKIHEDDCFWYMYTLNAKTIYYVNRQLYHYLLRPNSIMSRLTDKNNPQNKIKLEIAENVLDFAMRRQPVPWSIKKLVLEIFLDETRKTVPFLSETELREYCESLNRRIAEKLQVPCRFVPMCGTITNLYTGHTEMELLWKQIQLKAHYIANRLTGKKISDRLRFKIEENTARMEYTKKLRG